MPSYYEKKYAEFIQQYSKELDELFYDVEIKERPFEHRLVGDPDYVRSDGTIICRRCLSSKPGIILSRFMDELTGSNYRSLERMAQVDYNVNLVHLLYKKLSLYCYDCLMAEKLLPISTLDWSYGKNLLEFSPVLYM